MPDALLDASYSFALIARAATNLVLDDGRTWMLGFPNAADELTVDFLHRAMHRIHPKARITDFEVLDAHAGTTSRIRIALRGSGELADGQPLPDSLFLKLTPSGPAQRLFVDATGIGRSELEFYRHVRPGLPVPAPALHGLRTCCGDRRFVLLLEDLTARDVRLATVEERVTLEDAERVMDALAALHAHFHESPRFAHDLRFVPRLESRKRALRWERTITAQMIRRCERQFGEELGGRFADTARLCRDARDALESIWARGERTLVHGDCHLGNLFFEKDSVGFLDWQVCAFAPGMRDVSYFLCNSFPGDLRARHEHGLIQRYLASIGRAGVKPGTLEDAFDQHRAFALYTFIAAAFTAAAGESLQPREVALAGLRRAVRASEELESVDYCRAAASGRQRSR